MSATPTLANRGREAVPTHAAGSSEIVVMTLGLIVLALLLLAIVLGRRYVKKRREYGGLAGFDPDVDISDIDDAPELPDIVAGGIEARLAALASGSPRNAIVACWLDLEEVASRGGLPRQPAETSTEFTARVLSTYAVDSHAITALAALYREARFSVHPLTEAHRAAALAALQQLHADLLREAPPTAATVGSRP